jgi:hypothetical protein
VSAEYSMRRVKAAGDVPQEIHLSSSDTGTPS